MIRVTTEVVCDGCGAFVRGYYGDRPDSRIARAAAKRHGWRVCRVGGVAVEYCPKCAPERAPGPCKTHAQSAQELIAWMGRTYNVRLLPEGATDQQKDEAELRQLAELDEEIDRARKTIGLSAD